MEAQVQRNGKDFALFFAVNDYHSLTGLQGSIENAESIAKILSAKFGFQTEVIINPTFATITKTLRSYSSKFKDNLNESFPYESQILIYFIGFGGSKLENGLFYPSDVDTSNYRTAIASSILLPLLDRINCEHIFLVIDANKSASFFPARFRSNPTFKRPNEKKEIGFVLPNNEGKIFRSLLVSTYEDKSPDQMEFSKVFASTLSDFGSQHEIEILTSTSLISAIQSEVISIQNGRFGQDEPGSSFLFLPQYEVVGRNNDSKDFSNDLDSKQFDSITLKEHHYPVKKYSGISLIDGDNGLIVRVYWWDPVWIIFGFLFLYLSFYVRYLAYFLFSLERPIILRMIPGLFIIGLWLSMIFILVPELVNQTDFYKENNKLIVKTFPFFKKKHSQEFKVNEIKQLFVDEDGFGRSESINLYLLDTQNNRKTVFRDLQSYKEAEFLEYILESELKIKNFEILPLE